MLRFSWAAASDRGLVRTNNEDSGFAGPYLLLVADGVGGAAAGEVASATATYVVSALTMSATGAGTDQDLPALMSRGVRLAQEQLQHGVASDPTRAGMATTLSAVSTDGDRFCLAHLGDSRGILLRDGAVTQLTHDHTWVQAMLDDGRISAEEARVHPHRSVVLRSLAAEEPPQADVGWVDLREGDRLLLCSDGLTDFVAAEEIARLLAAGDPQAAVDALVAAALDAGGRDNVTCVVGDVVAGPRLCADGTLCGAVADPAHVLDMASVHLPEPA